MDDSEIDLRAIFGLLRRQLRLILFTVVAILSVATIVVFTLTPIYTASALILVDPRTKDLLDPEQQMSSSSGDSARIDSEVELMRSDSILLKVIEAQNLTSDPEFGVSVGLRTRILSFFRLSSVNPPSPEQALNQALSILRSSYSVQRRNLTNLISIQVRSENPGKSADLANAITKAYIDDQLASKVNSVLAARDILQARIIAARQAIVGSEGAYDTYISTNLSRIANETGRADLSQMQAQIEQLTAARSQNSALIDQVKKSLAEDDLDQIVATAQSAALTDLEQQRKAVQASLESAAPESPAALNLRQELAKVEASLKDAAVSELSTLQTSVTTSQEQEETLRQNLRQEILGSSLSTDVLTEIYGLQQSAELARNQYQTLLTRAQDLDTQANLQMADSRIVSPALRPEAPSFPNPTQILLIAALAALGLGIVLAFLYENLIGGFTSEGQMESVLKTPVASIVPRAKAKNERESVANMMVTSPLSVFAESIRRLRAAVEQNMRANNIAMTAGKGAVVMVTSTAPNEGKTTVSLSLARSYALSGRNTLLIDCDLRKPSVHRHLDIEPSLGLLDLLNSSSDSQISLSSVVSPDTLTSTMIIVGARRSDLPTDQMLSGPAFGRLINAARQTFDVIILDTPPVGPVVDALYIAPFSDFIVFVTRWASTSQLDAKRALAGLMSSKRPDTGVAAILNQQDEPRSSYQRKYGGYYSQTN